MEIENEKAVHPSHPEVVVPSGIKRRGFASMSKERRIEVARLGGTLAHHLGHAHVFSNLEAQAAGRKGGKTVSQNLEHMSRIGRIGGTARWHASRLAASLGTSLNDEQAEPQPGHSLRPG